MNRIRIIWATIFLTAALSCTASAGEEVIWAETLDEAWQLAQEHDRPMLVFITRPGCKYCTKMKSVTYRDDQVAQEVNNRFVPVMVTPATAGGLIKKLNVRQFPTTVVITPDYYVVDQLKGYLPPTDLYRRLSTVPLRVALLPARK